MKHPLRSRTVAWVAVAVASAAALGLGRAARAGDAPAPAPAPAASGAEVEVLLRNGRSISGRVETFDEKEVVVLTGPDQRRRVPWGELAPEGVYRVRAALVRPDDGAGRLALAELASELGLWAQARVEFEKALGLGAIGARAYERAVADAETRAVEVGIARATRLADAGDVAAALEVARILKIQFGGSRGAARVDGLVEALGARLAAREAELEEARTELEAQVLDVERRKEILKRLVEARRRSALGDQAAEEARKQAQKGVVSRVRRAVESADAEFVAARRELGRLRRILREDDAERPDALALLEDLDRRQYALLLAAAKFLWDQRIYGQAEEMAARASYVDPVDPELLRLRSDIRDRRIRYRVSGLSNLQPGVGR